GLGDDDANERERRSLYWPRLPPHRPRRLLYLRDRWQWRLGRLQTRNGPSAGGEPRDQDGRWREEHAPGADERRPLRLLDQRSAGDADRRRRVRQWQGRPHRLYGPEGRLHRLHHHAAELTLEDLTP